MPAADAALRSTPVIVTAIALAVAQVATQIYALVDLVRRDTVRGGKKWVWALVSALGNLPGAIAYLVAGRTVPQLHDHGIGSGPSAAGRDAARRAVDMLYDPPDKQ